MNGFVMLSAKDTAIATASILGVIATTIASLGVIWRTRPVRWLRKRLIDQPRAERIDHLRRQITDPLLAELSGIRRDLSSYAEDWRDLEATVVSHGERISRLERQAS